MLSESDLIEIMEKLCITVAGPASEAVEALAGYILAAHTAKLLAGVEIPEAKHFYYADDDHRAVRKPIDLFTKDQLQQYAAAAAAQARMEALDEAKGCNEADELLRNLHLDPERYRTEGGAINHLKVRAAILNPKDYCDHEWVTAPASLGGQLCSKCGRMK